MAAITREEVRSISRDEFRPDMERVQNELNSLREAVARSAQTNAEANANVAKAVERMSLIVVGDSDLKIPGMVEDLRVLKAERQASLLDKAKMSGIWIGASAVGLIVVKLAWLAVDSIFGKH